MLDILTDGFKEAKLKFAGKAVLTEESIEGAIQLIRNSLLEADVEYSVTKDFISSVKEKALGSVVELKAGKGSSRIQVSPGDHFISICKTELEALMGPVETGLNLPSNRPGVVMMVGLQGSGKTTTTGKLANHLIELKKKRLLVAGCL